MLREAVSQFSVGVMVHHANSTLIIAPGKLHLTARDSTDDELLTCFLKPACPAHYFPLSLFTVMESVERTLIVCESI